MEINSKSKTQVPLFTF